MPSSDLLTALSRPPVVIVEANAADAIVARLAGKTVGFDIETYGSVAHPAAGLDPRVSAIRLAQFFEEQERTVYIVDCQRTGTGWVRHLGLVHVVAHNAGFEVGHLLRLTPGRLSFECTMLAGRVLDGRNHSLKDLAQKWLGVELSKSLQASDWSAPNLTAEQLRYAAADAVAALMVWRQLEPALRGKYQDAYDLLKKLVYTVARQSGIRLDVDKHAALVTKWTREVEEARRELAQAGLTNPNSTIQKQQYLERVLPTELLAEWPTTPSGRLSTDADTLLKLTDVPAAAALATFSKRSSYLANFGGKLTGQLIDGLLYPDYQIAGAETGRFTCRSPNIQNMPRDGFKHVLLPPPGKMFVGGDLSQIELRVAGQVCEEEVINQAFREGRDLHRMMASNITGKPEHAISKDERQMAKAANFGLLYGSGAQSLRDQAEKSYGVAMDLAQAQAVKAVFHETYPALTEWQREIVAETNARGYSESRYVRLTRHYDRDVYTHAMNFPIQSSAWEVLALAIIYVDRHAPDGVTISHHVHDELVLASPPEKAVRAQALLQEAFLEAFKSVFPNAPCRGLVEIKTGPAWAHMAG
jgi:DNA polymerase-1